MIEDNAISTMSFVKHICRDIYFRFYWAAKCALIEVNRFNSEGKQLGGGLVIDALYADDVYHALYYDIEDYVCLDESKVGVFFSDQFIRIERKVVQSLANSDDGQSIWKIVVPITAKGQLMNCFELAKFVMSNVQSDYLLNTAIDAMYFVRKHDTGLRVSYVENFTLKNKYWCENESPRKKCVAIAALFRIPHQQVIFALKNYESSDYDEESDLFNILVSIAEVTSITEAQYKYYCKK